MRKAEKTTDKNKNYIAEASAQPVKKKRLWKEVLYNCPCLILLTATAMGAMLCSDELGVNLLPAGRAAIVKAVEMSGAAGQEEPEETAEAPESGLAETDQEQGAASPERTEAGENVESAGTENPSEIETALKGSETETSADGSESETEADDTEPVSGITRFEYYEPQYIESCYYSDAGKVAMTTEYDYVLENDSYFNDAVFLGDSRTLGISDYAGLDGADFYCESGMTIFKLLGDEGITDQKTGKKADIKQVLQEKQYGKIYMMLGMNELGYGNTEMYLKQYREVVEQIRKWQPEAIIFIMANLHVSEAKNNMETEFNNININDKNAASALLANGTDIFYLDCNPLFTDEEGFLNAESTFDGVHLYAQYYDRWKQFLCEHGVELPVTGENAGRLLTTGEPEMQKK